MDYFLGFKKYIEEFTSLLAHKLVEVMLTQSKKFIVFSSLSDLDLEYEVVWSFAQ